MQLALTQEKQAHEEDVDRLSREKVQFEPLHEKTNNLGSDHV